MLNVPGEGKGRVDKRERKMKKGEKNITNTSWPPTAPSPNLL
jgi:hypothetical protein